MEFVSSDLFFDSLSLVDVDDNEDDRRNPNPHPATNDRSSTSPTADDHRHHPLHLSWDDPLDFYAPATSSPSPPPFLFSRRPFLLDHHQVPFEDEEGSEWQNVLIEQELPDERDDRPTRRSLDWDSPVTVEYLDLDDYDDSEFYVGYHDVPWVSDIPTLRRNPTARSAVESLRSVVVDRGDEDKSCAVCKDAFGDGEEATCLPCSHLYHGGCITPWLAVANTCPLCRHELPTDDDDPQPTTRIVEQM